jgi:hypothetical protein
VQAQRLGDLLADAHVRRQRGQRVWKIMVIFEPRTRLTRGARPSSSCRAGWRNPRRGRSGQQAHHRHEGLALPEPLSPTTPRVWPRGMAS